MKRSLFIVISLFIGITYAHALEYISIQGYDSSVESICMEMTDTLTVSVDASWESGLDSHSWILAGDVSFANGYGANSNPCKIVVPSDGYGKGRVTYKFKEGRCSSMEYFDVFKSFVCPLGLEIKGPECIIDSQEVVYSVDPMLTKNLGAQIGIDSYKWNVLESNQPFVHEILYVSSDSSSITFKVGQVNPQNPPIITVSVGQCNDWELSKTLGNATPKPDLQDTMYLPVGFDDVKVGVINPKPNMEYTWACPSFAIEPYGANGDSAVIHITGQDADKMEFEVYVNATYTDITCNTSADTMKVVRTWGHTGIFDKNNITDSCYTQGTSYDFAVEGELPITTKCKWTLPQGWNVSETSALDLKTITIYPTSSAKLKDTLFVKPLDPHDTATPDTFIVHVRPDAIPVARIKQDSCLAYNYEGGVYIDTTGLHLPEGVEFEWNASGATIGESGGTDTLRFTPNINITSVQVRAKGISACDGEYTSYNIAYKPQKPNSIDWIDSACVSYGIQDNLEFAIANPLQNQKYRWQAPDGWEIVTDTTGGFVTQVEMTTNGVPGEHIIYVRGVNENNEQCPTSDAVSLNVVIPNYNVTIVPISGAGYIVASVSGQTPTIESASLYENGVKIEGAISSVLNYVLINQSHPRKNEFLSLGELTNNTTFSIEITMSLPNDCRLKYIYGAPLNNGQHQIISRASTPVKKQPASNYKLSAFPNPAYTELTISLSDIEDSIVDVFVLSTDGRILKTIHNLPIKSSIDVADLPQGTYLLSITCKGKPYSTIFMKQ